MRSGLVASARAMATRWRWPPEISWIARLANVGSQANALKQVGNRRWALVAVGDAMDPQRVGQRTADRGARVEGGERILKHHLDAPPHGAQRFATKRKQIRAAEIDAAGVGLDKAQQDARQRRLAAARRPDEAERLARARR